MLSITLLIIKISLSQVKHTYLGSRRYYFALTAKYILQLTPGKNIDTTTSCTGVAYPTVLKAQVQTELTHRKYKD